MELVYITPLC